VERVGPLLKLRFHQCRGFQAPRAAGKLMTSASTHTARSPMELHTRVHCNSSSTSIDPGCEVKARCLHALIAGNLTLIRKYACRSFSPALSLSILSPKLSWSEDETKAGVQRGFTVTHPDGTGFTPYDLKRLQARHWHVDIPDSA